MTNALKEKREAFRAAIAADVAALPLEMDITARPGLSDDAVEVSSASFASLGGFEIACWIARPRCEPIGVLVQFPAYATVLFPPVGYAEQGLVAVSVSVRGHHGSEIADTGFPGLLTRGLPDAETYVYRAICGDALRAATLVSQMVAPGLPLAFLGQSQGAALSLFAAAMTEVAVGVAADVPFLCAIRSALNETRAFPYRELSFYLRDNPDKADAALRTIDLVDVLGFAPLVSCPVLMSVGTHDPVTPVSSTRALAAILPDVEVIEYEGAGHEGGGMKHRVRQTEWLISRLAGGAHDH